MHMASSPTLATVVIPNAWKHETGTLSLGPSPFEQISTFHAQTLFWTGLFVASSWALALTFGQQGPV
jgi:hypothetical protein